MFLILDVGSGNRPKGDVNTDLHIEATFHRGTNESINVKMSQNFVKADCLHLPFKDNAFRIVLASHVIEHVQMPEQVILELLRVSSYKVILKCPHKFFSKRHKSHVNHFNCTWFTSLGKKLCVNCEVSISRWRGLPFDVFAVVRLPYELTVAIYKNMKVCDFSNHTN